MTDTSGSTPDEPLDLMGPQEARRLADWLAARPADQVITWGDLHLLLAPDVHRACWIDVTIDQAAEDLATAWCWTVVTPEDDDAAGAWPAHVSLTLAVPPDVTVHVAEGVDAYGNVGWYDDNGPSVVVPVGAQPDGGDLAPVLVRAAELGTRVVTADGWTNTAVNAALAAWTAQMTGRTDLTFAYNPDELADQFAELQALQAEADALDPDDMIDLGDGVRATPRGMDDLLALDPDTAAAITRTLKGLVGNDPDTGRAPGW